ncbi:hypothetical protein ASD24_13425 [Paenibacillus sp. Root52]|uniref:hypothetical protein n=1 Tax=Paenibacillus sp. Root52 TaxID=1736552 RepID=UPI0006F455EA|nr:hypothetical protein [Paenibacillus sp. Root52]KQY83274.1 hypothetical protein ASD24_13425 [Paenibacillus sp. Root52]
MKMISFEEAKSLGVETAYHLMDNGEKRFRLINNDGSSYIRTEGSENGSWQNSHYHQTLKELYVVQQGWIAYAELDEQNQFSLRILEKDDSVMVPPLRSHNIYMSSLAVTHVIKFGGNREIKPDWFASPQLDLLTKHISEIDLLTSKG